MGRFILRDLLNSIGLDHDQVAGMKANDLQNHLVEKGLAGGEILSIKRLRKRERIKRRGIKEGLALVSNVKELFQLKCQLENEIAQLQLELEFYRCEFM